MNDVCEAYYGKACMIKKDDFKCIFNCAKCSIYKGCNECLFVNTCRKSMNPKYDRWGLNKNNQS